MFIELKYFCSSRREKLVIFPGIGHRTFLCSNLFAQADTVLEIIVIAFKELSKTLFNAKIFLGLFIEVNYDQSIDHSVCRLVDRLI